VNTDRKALVRERCAFCDIIDEVPGATPILHSMSNAVAFAPLDPVTPGHLLVVPRVHVRDFSQDRGTARVVMDAAVELAQRLDGDLNLITSRGPAATQTVFHMHVHLVPRSAGDGLHLPWTGQ
jgi:histidine triad (HIT) family protein